MLHNVPKDTDIHIFNSNMQPTTPAEVILYILENAIHEGIFGIAGQRTLWYHDETLKVIDEYIKGLTDG